MKDKFAVQDAHKQSTEVHVGTEGGPQGGMQRPPKDESKGMSGLMTYDQLSPHVERLSRAQPALLPGALAGAHASVYDLFDTKKAAYRRNAVEAMRETAAHAREGGHSTGLAQRTMAAQAQVR